MKRGSFYIMMGLMFSSLLSAQDEVNVFGYFQTYYNSFSNKYGPPGPPTGEQNYSYNTLGIGQLNLFLQRPIGENFTAFVNFEYINNFSSGRGYGDYNIQEAYVRWDYKDYLRFKFGMAIPQFNAMFQIYNRTPLLPFLNRPKLYEATGGNLVDIFDILPQKSLLHIDGFVPTNLVNLEYAVYLSGPTNGFVSSPKNDLLPGYVPFGQTSVKYLGIGGRIGIVSGPVKAGISVTTDVENKRHYLQDMAKKYLPYMDDSVAQLYLNDQTNLGDLNRMRYGADITISLNNLTIAAEFLQTKTALSSVNQATLNQWHANDSYYIGNGFDKLFYYVSATYYFTDELYAFGLYDYLDDKADPFYFGVNGYYGMSGGAGYHVNDNMVVKVQCSRNQARYDIQELGPNDQRDFYDYWYTIGTSISF
ncbi:MAG: hypothetical protein ACOYNS_01875 [Bacteroidota bacterium]